MEEEKKKLGIETRVKWVEIEKKVESIAGERETESKNLKRQVRCLCENWR